MVSFEAPKKIGQDEDPNVPTNNTKDPYCLIYGSKTTRGHLAVGGPSIELANGDRPKLMRSLSARTPSSASLSSLKGGGDPELGLKPDKTKPVKEGRQRLRWNLVFNLLLCIFLPIPIWLPFVDKYCGTNIFLYVVPSIQGVFALFFTAVCVMAVRSVVILAKNRNTDFMQKMEKRKLKHDDIQHLVVLCVYKEPLELLLATIETLAAQSDKLRRNTTLVIGFEESSPELHRKQSEICERFRQSFKELVFSVHPRGIEGEIPGKCSNSNCAIRTGLSHLRKTSGESFDSDSVIITNGDSDNKFHPRYLENLTYAYLNDQDRTRCIYQSPLLYNWNLDESFFVTRVTGLLRAFLMMGALIPFSINTMSVFSFSATLCIKGDYIHPGYQMDDIIALIRWMGVCRRRLRVRLIPVATVSGPTSGRIPEDEFHEWARQARRWTIGAAEVFHYFMAKAKGIPILTSISWGTLFLFYYGIVLCCSSLFSLISGVATAAFFNGDETSSILLRYLSLGFLAHQYLVFAVVFILDRISLRFAEPKVTDSIGPVRNFLHWLCSPPVLLLYSLVEFSALHELAFRGKDVCSHKPSKKEQLSV